MYNKELPRGIKDAVIGGVFILVSLYIIVSSHSFKSDYGFIDVGSAFFPTMIAIFLIALSLLMIFDALLKYKTQITQEIKPKAYITHKRTLKALMEQHRVGLTIDHDALLNALREKRIAGYATDFDTLSGN